MTLVLVLSPKKIVGGVAEMTFRPHPRYGYEGGYKGNGPPQISKNIIINRNYVLFNILYHITIQITSLRFDYCFYVHSTIVI